MPGAIALADRTNMHRLCDELIQEIMAMTDDDVISSFQGTDQSTVNSLFAVDCVLAKFLDRARAEACKHMKLPPPEDMKPHYDSRWAKMDNLRRLNFI